MKYENIIEGKFKRRPNRFIAEVMVGDNEERAHVKNTGRLGELLLPGAEVFLEDHWGRMGTRKMRYSLIGVKKGSEFVNIDSQAPNKVVKEALHDGSIALPGMEQLAVIKGEHKFGDSRLDFYMEDSCGRKGLIEVKGVTLEVDGAARFPDAPTERGIKHINELAGTIEEGYKVYVIFVIQMKGVDRFEPNDATHKAFGDALRDARSKGVHVLAYDCLVTPDTLQIDRSIPVNL